MQPCFVFEHTFSEGREGHGDEASSPVCRSLARCATLPLEAAHRARAAAARRAFTKGAPGVVDVIAAGAPLGKVETHPVPAVRLLPVDRVVAGQPPVTDAITVDLADRCQQRHRDIAVTVPDLRISTVADPARYLVRNRPSSVISCGSSGSSIRPV
jgi:hypothetical protein